MTENPTPTPARTRTKPVQPAAPSERPAEAAECDATVDECGTPVDVTDNSNALLYESAPASAAKPDKARPNPLDDPSSEVSAVMKQTAKRFGENMMFRASTRPTFRHVPSGCFALDLMMLGGVPNGLATLFTGWQHCGKSTFGDRITASHQVVFPDMLAAKVDIEGTYDPIWGAKHGMDNDRLLLVQPTTGEDAADLIEALIRTREISVVMIDSVAAMVPLKEIEASTEDSVMGKYALLVSRLKRKIEAAILDERKRDHWVTVLVTNQYRMSMAQYGDPRVMPGGKAMPYLAAYHYDFKAKEVVVEGKTSHDARGADMGLIDHNIHTFTKQKNKLGNGLKETEVTLIRNPYHPLGEGFLDEAKTVLVEAKKRGFIIGSGDGSKPPYRIDGLDEKFKSLAEMIAFQYSDLDFYEHLKTRIISDYRRVIGMSSNPSEWRAGG